jgi:hypothetical protein
MMHPLTVLHLDLRAPLYYRKDEALSPFAGRGLPEESIFCFDLPLAQYLSIEPDEAHYLGDLLFGGAPEPEPVPERFELPQGTYMFAQVQELLDREACIWMATEVQKEGLWQRLRLEKRFYLRYLLEHGKRVTQVFRPYTPGA